MATLDDGLGGYYTVADNLIDEDKAIAAEAVTIAGGWAIFLTLRTHFSRHAILSGEQRSRLAHWDDFIDCL